MIRIIKELPNGYYIVLLNNGVRVIRSLQEVLILKEVGYERFK